MRLSIDVETYSDIDIKLGVYRYCESLNFQIMLFAYAFDENEVKMVDLMAGEKLPDEVYLALADPTITKTAYNANFERNAIKAHFGVYCPPEQWQCTMVKALILGLPMSLENVGKAINLADQKMGEGKDLIKYFCVPCKPTKTNGYRTRNLPKHDYKKWEIFKSYCKQDVIVERLLKNRFDKYRITPKEQKLWELDQRINDRGVAIDIDMVIKAIECSKIFNTKIEILAKELTGLDNPNSPIQIKKWLKEKTGKEIESIGKENVLELLQENSDNCVITLLELRQLMSRTSNKKYQTMRESRCNDGRVRGLLQFYGANRTGRWAGRLVQIHNLPQNHLKDLDMTRELLKKGKYDDIEFLYESIPDTLSQLVRTAFIPSEGNRFIVSDFSAIEARVIAWIAGEKWRQEVFRTHGKIYEASASQMFKVPIEQVTKGSPLRQKGKISELALGYGGGTGALISMGALKMGVVEEELQSLVYKWRAANKNIVKLWWACDAAAKKAIREKTTVPLHHGISFIYDFGVLFIELPSGRRLSYVHPKINENKITYKGVGQTSKHWIDISTRGPKLVENIVQAISRDCLAEAMLRIEKNGFEIVMHVHDEIIVDVPFGLGNIAQINALMCEPIEWAKGLLLKAEGFETNYYKKD